MNIQSLFDNMAQQSNEKLARSLLDPSGREVLWPVVFAGVKNIVKTSHLNNDTLKCIKSWLKSNDSQLQIPLLGLTVLHTISLNCNTIVRNQMAVAKLLKRLEKQLARSQGPQVATALVQVLVDWGYLFSEEELGARSQALLDPPRYRAMAAGCFPSPAVLAMQEEMQLGLPPVAPVRGEDFVRWMYRGAGAADRNLSFHAGTSGGGISAATGWATTQSGALPGGAPPAITTRMVPALCQRMKADAQRMITALSTCRTAARMQRHVELRADMDAVYREAERCSQWRRRVQDYTQCCDDTGSMSAVLAATDVINQALQHWQQFAGREVYDFLRISVPAPPSEFRRTVAADSWTKVATFNSNTGTSTDLADLLGMGHAPSLTAARPQQPVAESSPPPPPPQQQATALRGVRNPFPAPISGAATSTYAPGGSRPFATTAASKLPAPCRNPFVQTFAQPQPHLKQATATTGPSRQPGLGIPASDWDPFAPPPPLLAPAPGAAASQSTAAGSSAAEWANFPFNLPTGKPLAGSMEYSVQVSQQIVSSLPNGGMVSLPPGVSVLPSSSEAASASNGASVTARAAVSSAAASAPSQVSAGSFRQVPPVASSSTTASSAYIKPFQELLQPVGLHFTPPPPLASHLGFPAAAAATDTSASAHTTVPAPVAMFAPASDSSVTTVGTWQSAATSSPPSYPASGHTAVRAAAGATATALPAVVYPQVPDASLALLTPPGAAVAALCSTGNGSSSSGRGDGLAGGPTLEWQPEYERLASELRALWPAASSTDPLSFSQAVVGNGGAASAAAPAASIETLLATVLVRVKGMCEALAAQHARHLAALTTASVAASCARDAAANHRGLPHNSAEVSSSVVKSVLPLPSSTGGATFGSINGVGGASGSWAVFGANGRTIALGPLQQHLEQQQQQRRIGGSGGATAQDESLI